MTSDGWVPRLVALDIDGTLLKWVEGAGRPTRRSRRRSATPYAARATPACHVVLASGRSPHGMTPVADLLELHLDDAEPLWIVASNGAVVFRYPPLEVVHEETFDAAPAVRRSSSGTPPPWWRSRSAASATASPRSSPSASCPAR